MTYRLLSLVLTIGLGVGLANAAFVAAVLATGPRRDGSRSNPLALLAACLGLMAAEEVIRRAGLIELVPHAIAATVTLDYLIAPLVWHLARSWTAAGDPPRLGRRHLLPFALATGLMAPAYFTSAAGKLAWLHAGFPGMVRTVILGKLVVWPAYLAAALVHLHRFRREAGSAAPGGIASIRVRWFHRLLLALAGVGLAMAVLAIATAAGARPLVEADDLGGLFIAVATFVIAGVLIRHPIGPASSSPAPSHARKYATSPLDPERKREGLVRITAVMEERRPYLDPELTLDGLASQVGLPPNHLSQILNEAAGQHFYDFVNRYRVERAKVLLAEPDGGDRTLLSVAHEAGFNSKASFNRAFKRFTNQTPSQFALQSFPAS
ncbi:MAG: helix-turn-helix domain-containing protein [Gemmatimonadales bacterium]